MLHVCGFSSAKENLDSLVGSRKARGIVLNEVRVASSVCLITIVIQ